MVSAFPHNSEKSLNWKSCFKKDTLWKLILYLWSCNQSVALKHAITGEQVNRTLLNYRIFRNTVLHLMFRYYFTVSGYFFPPLCLHALLITYISFSFFCFLPIFSSFFKKETRRNTFFPVSSILPRRNLFLPEVFEPWLELYIHLNVA